jgi:hypothetical protein
MTGSAWLDMVATLVRAKAPEGDVSRTDDDMLACAHGTRGALVHVKGEIAIVAPSAAAGTTIASRLQARVEQYDASSYGLTAEAAQAAASAIVAHLR